MSEELLQSLNAIRDLVRSDSIQCETDEIKKFTIELLEQAIDESLDITTASSRDFTARFLDEQDDANKEPAKQAVTLFQAIQRLQAIVIELEQIGPLLNHGLRSANDIAWKAIDSLREECPEINVETLRRIKDQALVIATRNEQAWIALLRTRFETLTPASAVEGIGGSSPPTSSISMETLFKEVNAAGCEHCCSVLSPSAYFVDLLRMLSKLKATDDQTLQQKFFQRRADLKDLELSCFNTTNLVQYIDLVHEVLQSFSVKLAGTNSHADVADKGDVYFDQDLHMEVFRNAVFPVASFPYNFATSSIDHYLGTLGTSTLDVMKTFGSGYRIFQAKDVHKQAVEAAIRAAAEGNPPPESRADCQKIDGLSRLNDSVMQRALSAQSLGLVQEEYVVLTGEAYFSKPALEAYRSPMRTEDYNSAIGLRSVGELWGYNSDAEMLSDNENDKAGLTFVQAQLLPRCGLSLDELVEVLQTQYMGRRLLLTPANAAAKFSKRPEVLRLRSVPDASNTSNSLNVLVCRDLLSFVRLLRKLNWSISVLDATLSCLWRDQTGGITQGEKHIIAPRLHQSVTPDVIENIMAIREISKATGIDIQQLLTLWGVMDSFGPKSLFAILFIQEAPTSVLEVFGPNNDGDYLRESRTVGDAFVGLARAMSLSRSELEELLKNIVWGDERPPGLEQETVLDITTLSAIYRHSLLKKILKTTFRNLRLLLQQPPFSEFFDSPKRTLYILSQWNNLASLGWTAIDVLSTCPAQNPGDKSIDGEKNKIPGIVATLCAAAPSQDNPSPSSTSRTTILSAVRLQHPTATDTILSILIDDVLRFKNSEDQFVTAPQYLDETQDKIGSQGFEEGYILSPISASYFFEASSGSVMLDDTPILSSAIALEKGEAYLLGFGPAPVQPKVAGSRWKVKAINRDLRTLSWRTAHEVPLPPLTSFIAAKSSVIRLLEIVKSLSIVLQLVSKFQLQDDELLYFEQSKALGVGITLQNPSMADLQKLCTYFSMRRSARAISKNPNQLLRFLRWCNDEKSNGLLSTQISELTSSSDQTVSDILDHKYPDVPDELRKRLLQDMEELDGLLKIWSFFPPTKLSLLDESLLFDIAQPRMLDQHSEDFKLATAVRNDLKNKFDTFGKNVPTPYTAVVRKVVEESRAAMIQYLTNHQEMKNKAFTDADSLFEFFLIDVSMGPGLQTSRIKQAISTVHLYVQRCLLGLEVKNKVPSNVINRKDWEWMRSYQTWEANRKVFLYPENWLDPTLRDNKSELFKDFEAKIMQTNLDEENMSQLIKNYVYGVNDLSDLEIQAYLWDTQTAGTGAFHLFARSRSTPYIYYYRRLLVKASTTLPNSNRVDPSTRLLRWTAWQKMDMEIQTYESDAEGKTLSKPGSYLIPVIRRNRLFLFNPQILLKTRPNPVVQGSKISEMGNLSTGNSKPIKFWEVRMSWTELRNEQWSPKKVSQACLNIDPLPLDSLPSGKDDGNSWNNNIDMDGDRLPCIDNFKFWVRSSKADGNADQMATGVGEMLDIDMECSYQMPGSVGYKIGAFSLGTFRMRDYDVTTIAPEQRALSSWNRSSVWSKKNDPYYPPAVTTLRTQFSQVRIARPTTYTETYPTKYTDTIYHLGINNSALLGQMQWDYEAQKWQSTTWTISFDDSQAKRPTGLVADMISASTGSLRYIFLPDDASQQDSDSGSAVQIMNKMGPFLMERATSTIGTSSLYSALSGLSDKPDISTAFGGSKDPVFHEMAAPYSLYNWELGYHMVSLLMERLLATQQLDLALHVARYVFDPTVAGGDATKCWQFAPFRDPALVDKETPTQVVEKMIPAEGSNFEAAVSDWRESPFSPHVVARNYPKAYMKRMVRKYIEILIASGDQYFRQSTLESMPLAIQRYIEASHLFGAKPTTFNSLSKSKPRTFGSLTQALDFNSFNNTVVDLELDFPFKRLPKWRGYSGPRVDPSVTATGLMGILQTGYFCVPANPDLSRLRGLIDDRLYKIRNCQDINGKGVSLRLFEPALDPGDLIQAQAAGLSISSFLSESAAPSPKSRFLYLLAKALELCAELKVMGDEYLMIKEKKDAEALMALRQSQDLSLTTLALQMKTLQRDEAYKTLESLEETRRGHETRLMYHAQLAGEDGKSPKPGQEWNDIAQTMETVTKDDLRMSSTEKIEFDRANEAAGYNQKASILETTAGVLMALPRLVVNTAPVGVGVSMHWDASVMGQLLMTTAGVLKLVGQMKMDESTRAARKAQLMRQLQERRQQVNAAGRDIAVIDKQIAAQNIRIKICESDLNLQQKQIEHSKELETFYRTKYTNEKLYAWMDNAFCRIFQDTYEMASSMARTAQRAWKFESQQNTQFLKSTGYWDRSRDGMFSARYLYLDLKRMEQEFINNSYHDFEITKSISLRQINPWQLLSLRYNHMAEIKLDELLFDIDFPGQYLRRIKSVSVSIPCIVGPYTSISCTLKMNRNEIRLVAGKSENDQPTPMKVDDLPINSIAVSHGQSDTGMFDMSFGGNSDRYGPFEGAGVISEWVLELPSPVPQFDYTSITDVIMQIRYTSKAAEEASQSQASARVRQYMKEVTSAGANTSLLDIRNDFPNEWRRITQVAPGSSETADDVTLNLTEIHKRLPFWTKGRSVTATKTQLVVTTEDGSYPVITLQDGHTFEDGSEQLSGAQVLVNSTSMAINNDWTLRIQKKVGNGRLNGMFMILSYVVSGSGV
ncbi:hypothetical protein LTR84_006003 [Exophiala bonariae]|uniref:Toxin subunit n=1 Tax=Exophiala bonariae TaxID=1690606 RepID=A0AAV9N620_9EURO|nr:hypothetical protein LTR84_006003 [Exophiala bonariae]